MAAPKTTLEAMRRSTRIRVEIPLRVRSLDPDTPFDLLTTTIIINAQGCGLQSVSELPLDVPVELSIDDRTATGRTLNSAVIDAARNIYVTGIALDEPGNFWALPSPPADWGPHSATPAAPKKVHPFAKRRAPQPNLAPVPVPAKTPATAATANVEEIRARFDAILAEYSQRARAESAAEWKQWRTEAIETLNEMRHNLGAQLFSDTDTWKAEIRRAEGGLQQLLKAAEDRAGSADQQAEAIRSMVSSARADLSAAIEQLQKASAAAAADNAAARSTQDHAAKSLAELQRLSETVPGQVQERAAQVIESAAGAVEQKLTALISAELQALQDRVKQMAAAAGEQARSRMLADFDERQSALADSVAARIAEFEAKEKSVRASADEISVRLARQSEEAMAVLRKQVEDALTRHEAEINSRLTVRSDEFSKRVESDGAGRLQAIQVAAEKAVQDIEERGVALSGTHAELVRAAEAALEKIDARRADAQQAIEKATTASLEQLKSKVDSSQQQLETRMQEQGWEFEAQAEAASTRLQERLASALQRIDSDIEEKRSTITSASAEQAAKLAAEAARISDDAKASIADERARQVETFRQNIDSEFRQRNAELDAHHKQTLEGRAALDAQQQRVAADLANLEKTRSYIESLMTSLPDTLRTQAQKEASAAWDSLRQKSEQQIGETINRERDRAATALRDEIAASAQRLRQEMAAHAEQTATELQQKIVQEITSRRQELITELQAKAGQVVEQSTFAFAAAAQQESERRAGEAEAVHKKALQRLEEVAQKSDRLLSETEAAIYKSAEEVVNNELKRAQTDMQQRAAADSEASLARLREQSDKVIAEKTATLASATTNASELAAQLRASADQANTKSAALEKQLDDAQQWLAAHTAEFQKTVHDAFLSAGGEIRGRVASAADTAEELIRQRSRDALASMEAAAAQHAQAIARNVQDARLNLDAMQLSATESAETLLKARLAEALEAFRDDAARLAESTISRWQSAMDQTLRAVPDLLKNGMTPDKR